MAGTPRPGRPVRGSRSGRPIMALLDLLSRRWTLRVIWELREGRLTFRALQEACGGVSPTVLNERVRELRESGLLESAGAAVNGHAVGGGWGLALACDFRIAAAEAQFWIPEVDLGVPLGVGTTTRFVRMVGPARAKEIIMGCARYSAAEAQAWGLVNRVVPGAELAQAARDYAQLMAKKPVRPLAEVKARNNAIARTGIPEVNAMTEGFLDRE